MVELEVDEIGPSLRYATASVTKQARSNDSGGGDAAAVGSSAGSAGSYEEEAPF